MVRTDIDLSPKTICLISTLRPFSHELGLDVAWSARALVVNAFDGVSASHLNACTNDLDGLMPHFTVAALNRIKVQPGIVLALPYT